MNLVIKYMSLIVTLFRYSLAGKVLHQLALVYAALVAFAQKSEDFEVKVHGCKYFY